MASNAEGAAGRPEMVSLPKITVQAVLSIFWALQMRTGAENREIRGTYALEVDLDDLLLMGNLIKEIEAVVCPGGADDAPLSGPAPWRA